MVVIKSACAVRVGVHEILALATFLGLGVIDSEKHFTVRKSPLEIFHFISVSLNLFEKRIAHVQA